MDRETSERVKDLIQKVAEEEGIELEDIILFGSRAREDYSGHSDVDILLVSEDFEGVKWYERDKEFQRNWDYRELPAPEIICVTPDEFETRKKKLGDVIRKASKEGVSLA